MYDFCFTYPYAVLLGLGGVVGYASKGSTASLAGGLGSAAVLWACAHASHSAYQRGESNKAATAVSLVVAASLSAMMWQRYSRTNKIMPAGMVALMSMGMSAFYVWSLIAGPKPLRKAA